MLIPTWYFYGVVISVIICIINIAIIYFVNDKEFISDYFRDKSGAKRAFGIIVMVCLTGMLSWLNVFFEIYAFIFGKKQYKIDFEDINKWNAMKT